MLLGFFLPTSLPPRHGEAKAGVVPRRRILRREGHRVLGTYDGVPPPLLRPSSRLRDPFPYVFAIPSPDSHPLASQKLVHA